MSAPLIEARGLLRTYPPRVRGGRRVRAVDRVDLRVERGECVGLVGESGSGKSTLVRLLLALERPDAGEVRFDGTGLVGRSEAELRPLRRRMGAVFQDPGGSLNPRLTVARLVAEPLLGRSGPDPASRRRRVVELVARVGLPAEVASRLPSALSGGERQRVALARALATGPDLLVLDEPISALDVAVGARMLALVDRLRAERELTVVLVSHDLAVVGRFCDTVVVLERGAVVERGPTAAVLEAPLHPSTRRLLGSRLRLEPGRLPDAPGPATGGRWPEGACRLAPCCPEAGPECGAEPPLARVDGRDVACWRASDPRR